VVAGAASSQDAPDPATTRPASRAAAASASRTAAPIERGDLATLYRERRYDELIDRLRPKLIDDRAAVEAWLMAAEASLALDDAPLAIERFEKALDLRPDVKPLCVNYGFALLRVDRADEARRWFGAFLEDARFDRAAKARYGIGLAHKATGAVAEARAAFEAAVDLAPDDARPRYRLGELHLLEGRYDAAAEAFRDALERDRFLIGAAYGLARATRLLGKVDEAEAYEKKHADLIALAESVRKTLRRYGSTDDPARACFELASAHALAGDKKGAVRWLEKCLEHDPHHPAGSALKPALLAMPESRP
jgi:Tfp pilus assembly protein PilF